MLEHKNTRILNQYSIHTQRDLLGELRSEIQRSGIHKIVVLDDDPTGTQTGSQRSSLHGWDEESIKDIFANEYLLNFILTNSPEHLVKKKSVQVHQEIALNLKSLQRLLKRNTC